MARARSILVLLSVAFAIAAPAVRALADWGLSQDAFAAQGDETLRAAGWAFSIWGLIYAGLAAYAVFQLLPSRGASGLVRRLATPAVVAASASGLWIIAAAAAMNWATVVIITIGAAAIVAGLWRAAPATAAATPIERGLVLWPLSLMAGWLTAAAGLNWLTVLTAEGLVAAGSDPAALAGLALVLAVGLAVTWRTRLVPYPAALAWAFVGISAAERDRDLVGGAALAAAGLVVLAAAAALFRARSAGGR